MTVLHWLDAVSAAQATRPALLFEDEVWTYQRLWAKTRKAAAAVQRQPGFVPGARIGLLGDNEPSYLVAYLGILRAGGVVVPLNPRNRIDELRIQLDLVRAAWCMVDDRGSPQASELAQTHTVRTLAELGDHGHVVRSIPPAPSDHALVLLTSGSTGAPKGVVHTHGSLVHAGLSLLKALPFSHDDISIAFLPFFASVPEHALPVLMSGGALLILRRFDEATVLETCKRATTLAAVPTLIRRLLEVGGADQLGTLRWVSFASEPMPPNVLDRWWRELPHVDAYQYYGMTELLPITHAGPELQRMAPGTVGVAYPTSSVRIVDEDLRTLGPGEDGEVVCASPARMLKYLDDLGATHQALTKDGAMRTGDLGRLDERGRLFLTGRLKELIISGGHNVAPAEIEAVACMHPDVAAAAVVGIPDERWGETPVVVAVSARGRVISPEQVLIHCAAHLSSYKRPSAAAVVDDLPVTGIGKSAKSLIREAIMAGELEVVRRRPSAQPVDVGNETLTA